MRVTIYHEATKAKHEFQTIKEMREYAARLHGCTNHFDDYVNEGGKLSEISPYDVASDLYGSWGRVKIGKEIDNPTLCHR